jgi:hypothetical protein
MRLFEAEFELLRLAVRGRSSGHVPAEDEAGRLLRAVNWHHVLWLARKQRVLLLLRTTLARIGRGADYPTNVRAQLDGLHAAAQLQALQRAGEIVRLQDAFAEKQLPLVLADDWMFLRCFAPNEALSETRSVIRCLIHPADRLRAAEAVAAANHPLSEGQFQVAGPRQTPVELVEVEWPYPIANPQPLGGRTLPRLTEADWRLLLDAPSAPRDLFREWQLHALSQPPSVAPSPDSPSLTAATATAFSADSSVSVRSVPDATAPFVPTPALVAERMLALAGTDHRDLVCDLGSGDGSVVITAAGKFGARAIGIERDARLVAEAETNATVAGVGDKASFRCADLFTANLSGATVICLYLLPAYYETVRQHVLSRARPGTRVVSHDYFFSDWPPEQTELVRYGPAQVAQIYLWRVGQNPPA